MKLGSFSTTVGCRLQGAREFASWVRRGSCWECQQRESTFPTYSRPHVDKGLHELAQPYIMAHEVSHAFGVTDEGECNFLAALICRNSAHALLNYSGGLYELQRLYAALIRAAIQLSSCEAR